MKLIALTKGFSAKVDDQDFSELSRFNWHYTQGYAARHDASVPSRRVWMHRQIMGLKPGEHVDHINRDRLDNRRSNLRPCSITENNWNTGPMRTKKYSTYKGVTWSKQLKKWKASITANGVRYFLGYFDKEVHAVIAYTSAARVLHKKFALAYDPLSQ